MFIWFLFINKILFPFHPFNHKSETAPMNQSDLTQKVEGTIRASAEDRTSCPKKTCLLSKRISYLCSSTKAAKACWTQHCLLQAPKCDNAKTAWGAQQGHLQQRQQTEKTRHHQKSLRNVAWPVLWTMEMSLWGHIVCHLPLGQHLEFCFRGTN